MSSSEFGFTLIELLIVMGIISILAVMSSPFLSNFVLTTNLDSFESRLISSIRKAQEYSMDGKFGELWGVCIVEDKMRMFGGSCSDGRFSEDFDIPKSIDLNGFDEIVFNNNGEVESQTNFSFGNSMESVNVEINKLGRVEVN